VQRVKFLYLVAQQVEPRMSVAGRRFDGDAAIEQCQPHTVGCPHLGGERFELAKTIPPAHAALVPRQRLEFVLPVNVDQLLDHRAQHLRWHALAVEPGPTATIGRDHPSATAPARWQWTAPPAGAAARQLSLISKLAVTSARSVPARIIHAGATTASSSAHRPV
jgi:hypothetical protein